MSGDGQSDDISTLAGRVASVKRRAAAEHARSHDSSAADHSETDDFKWLKYAKAGFFLFVALAAVTFGFTFRSYSNSGDINFIQPPQRAAFDVYASNPYISVKLDLYVYGLINQAILTLIASAPQTVRSGTIILASTIPDENRGTSLFPMDKHEKSARSVYILQSSFRRSTKSGTGTFQAPVAAWIGFYNLSNTVLYTKDKLIVQMPGLEEYSSPQFSIPNLLSEKDPNTGKLIGFTDTTYYPINESTFSDPSDYHTAYGAPDMLFWSPQITTTEELAMGDELRNYQISSVVPTGTLQENTYNWQNNGRLGAYLSATDPNAIAVENAWDFRSGIAFGIAVGAAVAFVQELPDEIHPIRRWRKRHPKRS